MYHARHTQSATARDNCIAVNLTSHSYSYKIPTSFS